MARNGQFGQLANSAGAPNNTRELAQIDEKTPTRQQLGLQYWWRRRESNPRPQVLYSKIYILSPVFWVLALITPAGQA